LGGKSGVREGGESGGGCGGGGGWFCGLSEAAPEVPPGAGSVRTDWGIPGDSKGESTKRSTVEEEEEKGR